MEVAVTDAGTSTGNAGVNVCPRVKKRMEYNWNPRQPPFCTPSRKKIDFTRPPGAAYRDTYLPASGAALIEGCAATVPLMERVNGAFASFTLVVNSTVSISAALSN